MSRKSLFLALGIVLVLVGGVLTTLVMLVRHEMEWYVRAAVPPGPRRLEHSLEFLAEVKNELVAIGNNHDPIWCAQFTDEQINSFFAEGLAVAGHGGMTLPEDVSDPRIAIEPGRLRIGCRYGSGPWSSVISIDLAIWLAAGEQNAVVIEVERFRAGALPISSQSILQKVTDTMRSIMQMASMHGDKPGDPIDVVWYRNLQTGNPCAVVHFMTSDPQHPPYLLDAIQFTEGRMLIHCRFGDVGRTPPANPGLAAHPGPE